MNVDINIFINSIKSLNAFWFASSILCFLISLIIVPYKWFKILAFNNQNFNFTTIFKVNLISSYYNQILPTRIGGDSIKYIILSKNFEINKMILTSSIIVDRIFNLFCIFLIAVFASFFFKYNNFYDSSILIIFFFFFFFLLVLAFIPAIIKNIPQNNFIIKFYFKYTSILRSIIKSYNQMIFILIFSFLYTLLTFYMNFCVGKALDINIPFSYYLTFLPIISIATIIPISFSGFGIREGGFIYFLNLFYQHLQSEHYYVTHG